MLWAVAYVQQLNPLGNQLLSTFVAALPVLVLFYLLVPRRWLASLAGLSGAVVAILVAWLAYGMPLKMASWSFVYGAAFGLLPIGWTVFNAMLLYNITVITGQFKIIRRSIAGLSDDARVQAILIGLCFGAFLEGAAGAGSPVAVCGAILVGLGFNPFRAAVICLIANTSPVAFGGLGTPIITLAGVTGISGDTISVMAGHQLPLMSCLVPFYMVKTMCSWRETFAVWPALLVGGGSFALFQFLFATLHVLIPGAMPIWPMTDVGGGIFSLMITSIFLRFWKPKTRFHYDTPEPATTAMTPAQSEEAEHLLDGIDRKIVEAKEPPLTVSSVAKAWTPFVLMSIFLGLTGWFREYEKEKPVQLGPIQSRYEIEIPTLHLEVERAAQLQRPDLDEPEKEKAIFNFIWLTAPGTPVLWASIASIFFLRMSFRQVGSVIGRTFVQMKVPLPTIAFMLGLSYVTRYAGMDGTLGIAFAETGIMYPFFAAILGWLGVFLTGTDAGSNALFGSLQKITATAVHTAYADGAFQHLSLDQAQTLITTANSTGGVMGKMIDAQSICVATAGTNQIGREADIFKAVIWHSIALACIVGLLTLLQAYVPPFTYMVPYTGPH